jgi:hypothetical protein
MRRFVKRMIMAAYTYGIINGKTAQRWVNKWELWLD